MKPYYSDSHVTIYHGDCREILPTLDPVETCITDPPYGLSFMGKDWDHGVPGVHFWEIIRGSLLPGAMCLAFGGTRTHHRLMVAIEDAGFELRDCLMWLYGSGFPKSLDISKSIDKAGGCNPAEVSCILRARREEGRLSRADVAEKVGCTVSSVRDWEEGRARAKGQAVEHITPSTEYRSRLADLLGYTEDERRVCGVSVDRRGDGTGYGLGHTGTITEGGQTLTAQLWDGWGTALKPAWEPIILAMNPLAGTFAENAQEHGVAGLNVDGSRIGTETLPAATRGVTRMGTFLGAEGNETPERSGRWPANVVLDEDAARLLDEQSGNLQSGTAVGGMHRRSNKTANCYGHFVGERTEGDVCYGDAGGASRFFYTAKASRSDRGEGNTHPTVKPSDLMKWLCMLTATPTGGTIIDPFMGSGTTLYAAKEMGRKAIGMDTEEEHCEIAAQRCSQEVLAL